MIVNRLVHFIANSILYLIEDKPTTMKFDRAKADNVLLYILNNLNQPSVTFHKLFKILYFGGRIKDVAKIIGCDSLADKDINLLRQIVTSKKLLVVT